MGQLAGVPAFVLKYRLGPCYHHPAMLQDAGRPVRALGQKWGVAPRRIAVLGFSAGGHLASTAGTHFDAGKPDAEDPVERVSSRPDRSGSVPTRAFQEWPKLCAIWLKGQGFLDRTGGHASQAAP